MKRHYCTARGLKDILPKTTWKNICLKGGICTIRQAQEWLNLKPTQQNQMLKCYRCGKPIKGKVIPLEQTSTDKWDDDWGIEVISEGQIIIICLGCYRKLIR